MDQIKIGKLIATCRKEKKLTQIELAEKLGVTDKSVSKWENGVCLPDVSLYKSLCKILGITLNEFFSGERLDDKTFKEVADNNLLSALENSVFSLKDKVDFYKEKWQHDHFIELVIIIITIVFFIIYGFIKNNGLQYLFMILGFIISVLENNRMMSYVEKNVYGKNSEISINEFKSSIKKFKEFKEKISEFKNKKEAINYLIKETNLSKQECEKAYNFIMKTNFDKVK